MRLKDWIHNYPQVEALLQSDDDDLLYGVSDGLEAPDMPMERAAVEEAKAYLARLKALVQEAIAVVNREEGHARRESPSDAAYRREIRRCMQDLEREGSCG